MSIDFMHGKDIKMTFSLSKIPSVGAVLNKRNLVTVGLWVATTGAFAYAPKLGSAYPLLAGWSVGFILNQYALHRMNRNIVPSLFYAITAGASSLVVGHFLAATLFGTAPKTVDAPVEAQQQALPIEAVKPTEIANLCNPSSPNRKMTVQTDQGKKFTLTCGD